MRIPIVDEQDNVIGSEERSIVHEKGLRHREVHVWLVDKNKKIIFQKRALNKETWPGFLDATAGGHVDLESETYEKAAERELLEETGLNLPIIFVDKVYSETYDPNTKKQNNKFLSIFTAQYDDSVDKLVVERDSGLGFEAYSINELVNPSDEIKVRFIPSLISDKWIQIYKKILAKYENKN